MTQDTAEYVKALGTVEVEKAQGTEGQDRTLGILEEDRALDTLWVGTRKVAGRAVCTVIVGKTSC